MARPVGASDATGTPFGTTYRRLRARLPQGRELAAAGLRPRHRERRRPAHRQRPADRAGQLAGATAQIDAATHRYRVEADVAREGRAFWQYGTRTSTAWTFDSGHVHVAARLDLQVLRYDLGAGLLGAAPADRDITFGVSLDRPDASLKARASYDGGRPCQVCGCSGRHVIV
ncbi:hypothetical protein [Streptomyces sp. NPDC102360]|uniref:hypothetical protein n=1 Tax=Streptomyces sp. NPDC102360 TaxID=3366160 RepID=UPI0037F7D48D